QLRKETGNKYPASKTKTIVLSGGKLPGTDRDSIYHYKQKLTGEAAQVHLSFQQVSDLVNKYGTNTEKIIERAYELTDKETDADKRILFAELDYGMNEEMVTNLSDFLIRRTGRLYFERNYVMSIYQLLKDKIALDLQWGEIQKAQHDSA